MALCGLYKSTLHASADIMSPVALKLGKAFVSLHVQVRSLSPREINSLRSEYNKMSVHL